MSNFTGHDSTVTITGQSLVIDRRLLAHNQAPAPTGPSFVGFDVETANRARGSICAIGLTVVESGVVTATHSWLCRPPAGLESFERGNIRVHGITAHDVARQPAFRQRLGDMLDVVGNLPLIAHNAPFDIGALREASAVAGESWRPLAYGCTLRWSRRDLPNLPNHKLPTVADALGVDLRQHHDAAADATAAAGIALGLMRLKDATSVEDYVAKSRSTLGEATVERSTPPGDLTRQEGRQGSGRPTWAALRGSAEPPAPDPDASPDHPLFGHTVVLTGPMGDLGRDEAWAQIAACGATVAKSVTKKTTVLVLGSWVDAAGRPVATAKLTRARSLIESGQRLVILDARQLAAALAGDRRVELPAVTAPAAATEAPAAVVPQSPRKMVRGKHINSWIPVVDQLKRDGQLDDALTLLLECVIVAERTENCVDGEPIPEWTLQAGIVYRKMRDHRGEVAVLQRWLRRARRNGLGTSPTHPVVVRLAKAQALLDR